MSDRGRTVVDGLHSTEPNCSDRVGQYGKKETALSIEARTEQEDIYNKINL